MARGEEALVKIRLGLALSISLVACDPAPDRAGTSTTSKPSAAPPASASASGSAWPAGAQATAAPAAAPADPLAGTWEGSYNAKKGNVSLPPKVKDKALAADDGKASSGAGTIEIVIGPSGELHGKSTGALGACTLVGRVDEGMIRAKMDPEDPRAPSAMTGVLVGKLDGDSIRADLHVAGPDATVVRESAVELKRKK